MPTIPKTDVLRIAMAVSWLLLVLTACGGAERDATEGRDPKPRGGDIGSEYVDALDDAEAVEDLARERRERLDAAAEKSD